MAFEENRYDGHTLPEAFAQVERILGHVPKIFLGDRGYGCCRIQLQKVDAGSLFLACDYPAVIFPENQHRLFIAEKGGHNCPPMMKPNQTFYR